MRNCIQLLSECKHPSGQTITPSVKAMIELYLCHFDEQLLTLKKHVPNKMDE